MAKKTVVAHLEKRDKKRPMAYVDRKGNVVHFAPRGGRRKVRKSILERGVVSKELLKARRDLKILLYVKGKKVFKVKNGLKRRRRGHR